MKVFRHAAQLVGLSAPGELHRTGEQMRDPGILADGAMILDEDRIAWLGPTAQLPAFPADAEVIDLHGKVIVPGFVDSHTHLVFAGDRVDEWEQRLRGATYQEISARGGGIMATVRAVRQATREHLKALARPRL
jgi:imidazolonepropionase